MTGNNLILHKVLVTSETEQGNLETNLDDTVNVNIDIDLTLPTDCTNIWRDLSNLEHGHYRFTAGRSANLWFTVLSG